MHDKMLIEEVLEKYEESLILPPQPSRRLFLLCPVGLVGAGKSTVTVPLAERLSLVRISRDELRKLLKERGSGYEEIEEMTKVLLNKYLSLGFSIAIDSDCAHPQTIELIKSLEEEYGVLSIWIHINPPEDFILNKLRTYNHTWLFRDADEAIDNYMRRKHLHEHLPMTFLHTFDTSREGLSEEIKETAHKIESTYS